MHFSAAVFISALVSTVSASLVSRQAPACFFQCTGQADLDGCPLTDTACLCRSEKFINAVTLCYKEICQGADLQAALNTVRALCSVVGVTPTFPVRIAATTTSTPAVPTFNPGISFGITTSGTIPNIFATSSTSSRVTISSTIFSPVTSSSAASSTATISITVSGPAAGDAGSANRLNAVDIAASSDAASSPAPSNAASAN